MVITVPPELAVEVERIASECEQTPAEFIFEAVMQSCKLIEESIRHSEASEMDINAGIRAANRREFVSEDKIEAVFRELTQ